jgi:ribose 5-phosphate isomerase A
MTNTDKAVDFVADGMTVGLGSGRAAQRFIRTLADRAGKGLHVRCVATSQASADLAAELGLHLVTLDEVSHLDLTVDGADEVDPQLNLIKGYGRALVREKIVAASSRRLVILVGSEKLVPHLGARGRLPVEVVPFAVPLCTRRLAALGLEPALWEEDGQPGWTDNGNHILDCGTGPVPARLEADIRAIPGVVGTGLFLGMADTVLVGDDRDFGLVGERRRDAATHKRHLTEGGS